MLSDGDEIIVGRYRLSFLEPRARSPDRPRGRPRAVLAAGRRSGPSRGRRAAERPGALRRVVSRPHGSHDRRALAEGRHRQDDRRAHPRRRAAAQRRAHAGGRPRPAGQPVRLLRPPHRRRADDRRRALRARQRRRGDPRRHDPRQPEPRRGRADARRQDGPRADAQARAGRRCPRTTRWS